MTQENPPAAAQAAGRSPLPRGVWALGMVSLFMDLSSEMIHAVLPAFLVAGLGVSALAVGLIEGVAEATAAVVKLFSGALSDRLGKRKALAVAGYGLAALTKPLFPLAQGAGLVLTARFIDRIGKGIRGAPRDALVADMTPPAQRGAAYGLRQTLDTVGALLGPLVAIAIMLATGDDFRMVFWVAVLPAFLAVAVLMVFVRESQTVPARRDAPVLAIGPATWRRMGRGFTVLMIVTTVLTLARFSEAFLLLRGVDLGMAVAWAPLVMVVMNVTYVASAYPVGLLSDRIGRFDLLIAGVALLVVADIVLAAATGPLMVLFGTALWGLHLGLTQGLLSALVADAAPADSRGTAFGLFNLVSGLALLVASGLAGALWTVIGPAATFWAGAGFTVLAVLGLLYSRRYRS